MGEKKPESNGTGVNWEPPRRRRWREEDARAGLAAARASGKRLSAFAREHGFHVSRLYWWMKALNEEPAQPAAFLPVRVVEKQARSEQREADSRQGGLTPTTVDVVVGRKRVIRVGRGFDPALLRAVIAALEMEPC